MKYVKRESIVLTSYWLFLLLKKLTPLKNQDFINYLETIVEILI